MLLVQKKLAASSTTLLVLLALLLATMLIVVRWNSHTGERSSSRSVPSLESHPVLHRRPSVKQLADLIPLMHVADMSSDPAFSLVREKGKEVRDLPTIADVYNKSTGVIGIHDAKDFVSADRFAVFMKKVQKNASHYLPLLSRPTFWSKLKAKEPRMIYLHQTLADEFADDLIRVAEKQIRRSQVIMKPGDGAEAKLQLEAVDPVRTSYGMFITDEDWTQPATMSLRLRAARAVGVPEENIEATQILRYQGGQFYKSHLDAFDDWDKANMDRGGQRVATMLTWLNDVPAGGETSFPLAGVKIAPRKGDSVLFYDVQRDMSIDKFAEHGGDPPLNESVKWCAVLWIHPRRFD